MNIDFKDFDYRVINHNQRTPVIVPPVPGIVQGRENIKYDFEFREDNDGFYLIARSQICIPVTGHSQGDFLMFDSDLTILIPYEQTAGKTDPLIKIDNAVRAEFLYYHLCRQSGIIYADTHNRFNGNGHEISVPTIHELYKTEAM